MRLSARRNLVGTASCRRIAKRLQTFLDGELDTASAATVARHLEACRRCGLEADTYERVKASLTRADADHAADRAMALVRLRRFAAGLINPDESSREPD